MCINFLFLFHLTSYDSVLHTGSSFTLLKWALKCTLNSYFKIYWCWNVAIYVTCLYRCMHNSSLILVSSGECDEDEKRISMMMQTPWNHWSLCHKKGQIFVSTRCSKLSHDSDLQRGSEKSCVLVTLVLLLI